MRGSRNRRNMSYDERRAYRKRKKLLRKIQVYSEIGVITLAIVVSAGLIVSHIHGKKDDSKVATEQTLSKNEKSLEVSKEDKSKEKSKEESKEKSKKKSEDSKGLKVSAKAAKEEEEPEETKTIPEEETAKSGNFSAKESDKVASIGGDVVSQYGILINNKTKEIVADRNGKEKIVPASMTKVMTVLTASKHLKPEQLDEKVTMSHEAVDYSYAGGGSTSGFAEGEEVKVRDLFYGTILPSGGDAAAQLAMYVSGDIDSFVKLMNEEAKNLGISETTHFTNPVGFHNEKHYSTPYDIAIIMMAALDDETCKEVITTKVYNSSATNINAEGITISNWFLRRIEDKEFGGTIEGAKTGFVDESGSCAVSSMVTDGGTEYICCTAKSSSSWRCINDHVDIYKTYAK